MIQKNAQKPCGSSASFYAFHLRNKFAFACNAVRSHRSRMASFMLRTYSST
jgi:hypothetical protein